MSSFDAKVVSVCAMFGVASAVSVLAASRFRKQAEAAEKLLDSERLGRTKAERALRQRVQETHDTEGHTFPAIGYVESCFPGRCGAPRQGLLAPSTRGKLRLSSHISPFAIDGLAQYSHLWVIFVFDENTNATSTKGKSAKARTFPAKVAPPQLLGKKVGLYSTRTPHRPNPIGLTLVKVLEVDVNKRTLTLGGLDLVHDTPVLDIKPYIPSYDSLPDARVSSWVVEGGAAVLPVQLSAEATEQFENIRLPKSSQFVSDRALLVQALKEVLQLDIRSTHQGRGKPGAAEAARVPKPYETHFDCLRVQFKTEDGMVTVVHLELDDKRKKRYQGKR